MAVLKYERGNYQNYLERITKDGTYQDYENAIYEMNELRKRFKEKGIEAKTLIDQVDNVYYGDIAFPLPQGINELSVYLRAGRIIGELVNAGVIESKINDACLYFNRALNSLMYTGVVVKAEDGPDLYAQGTREFIVR